MLAHELGHVKIRDILTSSIAATLAGAITLIARMGHWASLFGGYGGGRGGRSRNGGLGALLMLIVAPIAASLIQLAISRLPRVPGRRDGSAYHRRPLAALARALQKLQDDLEGACRSRPTVFYRESWSPSASPIRSWRRGETVFDLYSHAAGTENRRSDRRVTSSSAGP